jgi:hypothetical protein
MPPLRCPIAARSDAEAEAQGEAKAQKWRESRGQKEFEVLLIRRVQKGERVKNAPGATHIVVIGTKADLEAARKEQLPSSPSSSKSEGSDEDGSEESSSESESSEQDAAPAAPAPAAKKAERRGGGRRR